jgi:NAD(P)-dependent dehydrogenase (short-subunit alcohol dehydrogenase family)
MLITGGSRGIGAATARLAARRGYDVAIGFVTNDQAAATVVSECTAAGTRAVAIRCDVSVEADIVGLMDDTVDRLGVPVAFVNNAGILRHASRLDEMTVERMQAVVAVNVVGAMVAAREAVRRMSTRHGGHGGSIVNVSSVNGVVGAPGIAGYVTAKFGIRGLTKTAALELGRSGIRVNSIHPGPIDTAMVQPQSWGGFDMRPVLASKMPLGRIGQPEEVAELVVWLASAASSYCTGAEFVIDGGYLAGPFDALGRR